MFNSLPGDIYLTRNTPELNKTLGYWQHAAIVANGLIIEGQAGPGQVILVREDYFRKRNPEHIVLRSTNQEIAQRAAIAAFNYIGVKYDVKFFNCVTLVRRCFSDAGKGFLWLMPDGIERCKFFERVEYFSDYINWEQPLDWYAGRIL